MERVQALTNLLKGHLDRRHNEQVKEVLVGKFHSKKFRMMFFLNGAVGICTNRVAFYGEKFIGYFFETLSFSEIISARIGDSGDELYLETDAGTVTIKQAEHGSLEHFKNTLLEAMKEASQ